MNVHKSNYWNIVSMYFIMRSAINGNTVKLKVLVYMYTELQILDVYNANNHISF